MERNNNKKKHENRKKKNKEFAFVLGLPLVFNRGTVGQVVQEFTNIGLKLIDLRCMSVTREFIEAHFQKKGRYTFTGPVMEFVTRGPFLAMKLQGDDAVKRAFQHVSLTTKHPLWDVWPLVYCSDSVESAQEDAAMWFCADSESSDIMKRKNLVFRLYDGSICSGSMEKLSKEELKEMRIKIDFELERVNQRFVLIKPKAVREGIMPELLASIDRMGCYVKGVKLVKKSEVPCSVAWSDDDGSSSLDATSKKGEFGIALIVCPPKYAFDENGSLCLGVDTTGDFVFVSEKGESLKFAMEFFKFGLVGWVDQASKEFCGGKYEPTLTGLLY